MFHRCYIEECCSSEELCISPMSHHAMSKIVKQTKTIYSMQHSGKSKTRERSTNVSSVFQFKKDVGQTMHTMDLKIYVAPKHICMTIILYIHFALPSNVLMLMSTLSDFPTYSNFYEGDARAVHESTTASCTIN